MEEEEEIKELLCMIMNEKGDLAMLESLMSKYAANLDLRQEIVQSTTRGREKIKVSPRTFTTLH